MYLQLCLKYINYNILNIFKGIFKTADIKLWLVLDTFNCFQICRQAVKAKVATSLQYIFAIKCMVRTEVTI